MIDMRIVRTGPKIKRVAMVMWRFFWITARLRRHEFRHTSNALPHKDRSAYADSPTHVSHLCFVRRYDGNHYAFTARDVQVYSQAREEKQAVNRGDSRVYSTRVTFACPGR